MYIPPCKPFQVKKMDGQESASTCDETYALSQPRKPVECPAWLRIAMKVTTYLNCLGMKSDGTYNRIISSWLEIKVSPVEPKDGVPVSSKDVIIDHSANISARIFVPRLLDKAAPSPLVVYFHGGGFACESAESVWYDMACKRIAKELRAVVLSSNYRKTPEHRCPLQYEDSFSALRWAASEVGRSHLPSNTDMSKCILMGDSAGGNIVHHVGCMAALSKSKGDNELGGLSVAGMVLIQPFFGGENTVDSEVRLEGAPIVSKRNSEWCWLAFLPEDNEHGRDHPCCNVVGPKAPSWLDELRLPPIMVAVGGHDPLMDWQVNYAEAMRKKKNKNVELVFYGEAMHTFHLIQFLNVTKIFYQDLARFVERCCNT